MSDEQQAQEPERMSLAEQAKQFAEMSAGIGEAAVKKAAEFQELTSTLSEQEREAILSRYVETGTHTTQIWLDGDEVNRIIGPHIEAMMRAKQRREQREDEQPQEE